MTHPNEIADDAEPETDEMENSLVKVPEVRGVSTALAPFTQAAAPSIRTTLAPIPTIRAINLSKPFPEEMINKVMKVVHLVQHQVSILVKETGVSVPKMRTVFVLEGGEAYAVVSDGVDASLPVIFSAIGLPPWNPPASLVIMTARTRAGYRVYKLVPDIS